jgi:hypothetical protein
LSDEDYDNYDVVPDVQVNISNNISVWGYGEFQFLSIGMTSVTATNLGLSAMFHSDTQYLYNMVGAITKNISNFNQFDMFNRSVVYTKPLHLYADQYLHRSLRNLFETVPYANWIFSDAMWRLAPNVFNARQLTGDVAEYYFRNCSRAVRNVAQNDGSRETIFGLNVQAKSGITGHLRSSILSFMQNVKSDEYVFDEDSDYLAPLVILAMIENRSNVVTGSREDAPKVLQAFSECSVTWETILSNPTQVAERMIANDTRLADALLGIVDFEE